MQKWIKMIGSLFKCILITLVITIVGQILGRFLISIVTDLFTKSTETSLTSSWKTALMYFSSIGLWIVTIIAIVACKKNRFILNKIGRKNSGNTYKSLFIGLIIGFFMNFICILVAMLNHDIQLEFVGFYPISFIIVFLCVFIQSSAEEVICRGFLYQKVLQNFDKPIVAILSNSLLFSVLHLGNEGVTALSVLNIFLVGIMFSLIIYYTDSLWCVFAIHAAWNFTQNIIFGLPNSGIVTEYSVYHLNMNTAKDSFAYNVGFGIEGTIFADLVLLAGCICTYLWGRNKKKKETIE